MTKNKKSIDSDLDVVFGQGGGRELKLDVYKPTGNRNSAAKGTGVLAVHGGGWRQGTKERASRLAIPLAERGYVTLASEYRLSDEAIWPAQIHDVKAALRWMRRNADDLGIDPELIVVLGMSAGAHLALMLAGTPNVDRFEGDGGNAGISTEVAGSIALYAPTDLARILKGDMVARLIGSPDDMETARDASPVNHVTKLFPPTFLAHGKSDKVVSWRASQEMSDAITAVGGTVETHLFAGLPHAFDTNPIYAEQMADLMDLFIEHHVIAATQEEQAAAE